MMKCEFPIGVCTWSLQNDLTGVTSLLTGNGLSHLHLDVSAADAFSAAIKQHQWTVSSAMVSFPQEDYSTLDRIRETGGIVPDAQWPDNQRIAHDAIQTAARLGTPYCSMHAGFMDHHDRPAYDTFCARIGELAAAAQSNGIMLLLETGQETAADLRRFLEDLNHPALGVNFDPANMILYGKGDPVDALQVLGPWIRHVHIKDAIASPVPGEWGSEVPWGEGDVPHAAFLQTLQAIGFDGVVAIEREAGDDRTGDIQLAIDRLRVKQDG